MMTVSMVGAVVACAAVGTVYRLPWFYILVLAIAAGSLVAYLYLRYFMLYFNFAMFVNIALLLIMGNNLGFLQYGAPGRPLGHAAPRSSPLGAARRGARPLAGSTLRCLAGRLAPSRPCSRCRSRWRCWCRASSSRATSASLLRWCRP